MNERPENARNIMPNFVGIILIAVIAWILGSPILGVALGIGAVVAMVITLAGHRGGVNSTEATPQL